TGAALAGEISRNSFQTALATIGVTNQYCKKSYYNCQTRMYKPIIDSAKSSCKVLLYEILDHLELTHSPGQEKLLLIGFDCLWSYCCNAYQASEEFLYLGDIPDVMISKVYTAATGKDFSYSDLYNTQNFVKERSKIELAGFDFDKELVSYKSKASKQIQGQIEAIISYLSGKDIFISMKTGRGKTLCYALSAICFEGLTIVFSQLKALMNDQKRELINAGILYATLYANLVQGASI
ncbi:8878_t:CDS:2, partial [Funneliformis geosporum]